MPLPRLIAATCLLASFSCSSTRQAKKIKVPPALVASRGGVKAAVDRHVSVAHEIRNAVDAGEGDFEARQLRQSLVNRPGDLDTRLRLAARYEVLGMPELAIEHYRLAAERFPAEVAPPLRLARALHQQGHSAEAAAILESYVSAYPEAPAEVHSWAGIVRDSLGHHKVAEQHHRDALEHSSASVAYLRNNLGQNLALQERGPEAVSEFRAALQLEPANLLARNNLAISLAADPAESARVFQTGTDDPATAHSNLAAILIEKGRYAEARKELNLALGYKPDHREALSNLMIVSDLDGKPATMLLAKQSDPAAARGAGGRKAGGWSRVGRAIARVFTTSETRPPEQSAASVGSVPPTKKKAKAERVKAGHTRNSE